MSYRSRIGGKMTEKRKNEDNRVKGERESESDKAREKGSILTKKRTNNSSYSLFVPL